MGLKWLPIQKYSFLDSFSVLFCVQNLCCNDWISLLQLKRRFSLEFDIFEKEQLYPPFFFNLLQVFTKNTLFLLFFALMCPFVLRIRLFAFSPHKPRQLPGWLCLVAGNRKPRVFPFLSESTRSQQTVCTMASFHHYYQNPNRFSFHI